MLSLEMAKKLFYEKFKEKTGNDFSAVIFEKKPKKYNYLMTSDEEIVQAYKIAHSSSLQKSVEDLLKLLVDVDRMENIMIKFHLDTAKCPLIKIEENHIKKAKFVLTEIYHRIKNKETRAQLTEASNRFYSLIPHGVNSQSVLDTEDSLKEKSEMLDSLKEMQFTYKLLYKDTGEEANSILDSFYKQLDVQIDPLEKSSLEYENVVKYAENGREGHDFEIEEVYKIERSGEEYRYETYENLSHRTFLWHGSKIIKFPSILTHGLKLEFAEPGIFSATNKGLYFADVFAKASYFCFANESDRIGLVLLCEVALGNSYACSEPKDVKLPDNYQSVYGVGRFKFPAIDYIDGVEIPCGKPIESLMTEEEPVECGSMNYPFLKYNEFVVHNEAQVKLRYLVKVKFNSIISQELI